MIIENPAAKRSVVVALVGALGLPLPTGAAWAGPRVLRPSVRAVPQSLALPPSFAVPPRPIDELIGLLQTAGVSLVETGGPRAEAVNLEAAARVLPEDSAACRKLAQLAVGLRAGSPGHVLHAAFDGRGVGGDAVAPAPRELTAEEVRYTPPPEWLPASTRDLSSESRRVVVGQDKALEAIRFGLEMRPAHYNLFISGPEGSGRATAARLLAEEVARTMETPGDLVAASDFGDRAQAPVILELPPGRGADFVGGVRTFVALMKEKLPIELGSGHTARQKKKILDKAERSSAARRAAFDAKLGAVGLVGGKFGAGIDSGSQEDHPVLFVTHDGKPVTPEQAAAKILIGSFTQKDLDRARAELDARSKSLLHEFDLIRNADSRQRERARAEAERLDVRAAERMAGELAEGLLDSISGQATPEDEALRKSIQEREAAIEEEFQALGLKTFGIFGASVQLKRASRGLRIDAALVFEDHVLGDDVHQDPNLEEMLRSGKFTGDERQAALDALSKEAQALADKLREHFVWVEEASRKNFQATLGPRFAEIEAYVRRMAEFAASNHGIFLSGAAEFDAADLFRADLLVDNALRKGAPVIWEEHPTYEGLFGSANANDIEILKPDSGDVVRLPGPGGPTLKAGSFLKANGGFLIMDAREAVESPGVWPALMSAVRTGRAEITEGGLFGLASMRGEIYRVPGKVKVVLIGSPMVQMLLESHDEDFAANFTVQARFQPVIASTRESIEIILKFLKRSIEVSGGELMDMTRDGITRFFEDAARMADSNRDFTARFGALRGLHQESSYWARRAGRSEVSSLDVEAALKGRKDREDGGHGAIEAYTSGDIWAETSGSVVGQINGLAVAGSQGVPLRVTFVATPGEPGIVVTDKDAGRSGALFNKALGDVYGWLAREFGQKRALKAHIHVSYEQNYGAIDGDSSASTTIYGILSALSGVPISQGLAVTGSADQLGRVQPIGGANEKIEGFFALCKHRGLTGDQGVIIPSKNVSELQLSSEVVEAIRAGKFHIYPVDTITQGIERLTGVDYQTIKKKADERLQAISRAVNPG